MKIGNRIPPIKPGYHFTIRFMCGDGDSYPEEICVIATEDEANLLSGFLDKYEGISDFSDTHAFFRNFFEEDFDRKRLSEPSGTFDWPRDGVEDEFYAQLVNWECIWVSIDTGYSYKVKAD